MKNDDFEMLKAKIQVAKWILNAYQLEHRKETGQSYLAAGPGNPEQLHLATQQVLKDLEEVAA